MVAVFITFSLNLFRNNASFMHSHVQRLPGFPEQNGTDSRIKLYVEYPGGGTMRQDILQLIINVQLQSVGTDSGFNLTLVPIIEEPEVTSPLTDDRINNSISVVLKNFQADQVCWSNLCGGKKLEISFKPKRKKILRLIIVQPSNELFSHDF